MRDNAAFTALVEQEATTCYRACFRILGNAADAEDAVQEALVTAYRSAHGFRGDGAPGAWLITIVTRVALRRLARRRPVVPIDEVVEREPAGASSPLSRTIEEEERARVRSAVLELPDPYRETVALRYFAELSVAEVAAATGRPLGTTKSHLRRGLRLLRNRLDDGGPS